VAGRCGVSNIRRIQSASAEVLRQPLVNSGTAMQGMPASRILSSVFSSTSRQATPNSASTWPPRMIFITAGEPSAINTR
jgi:hypothetical protein